MDYTPISTRRVLLAFALTGFVALLPALYFALHQGGASRGVLLVSGSVVLTAALIGAPVVVVSIGRRLIRRPIRA
jgi:hypothetical protein